MSLQLLQESFVQQLIRPDEKNDFLAHLTPSGNLQPKQQLAIYQTNMRSALQKTLAQIYPVCHKIVGEKYFRQLARYYINEQPSEDSNLNNYGENFSDFVQFQCQQRSELNDFSYLSDLVRLEWFYHSIYYAAEGAVFDLSAFSQLTPAKQASCSFLLAPQLKFMASKYPVLSIWNLNQQEEGLQQLLNTNAENCCVFRENNSLKIIQINDSIYRLLKNIEARQTLAEMSETASVSYLPELIQSNWISSFKIHHVQK